eukprot:TRINITY_DN8617_c0_g1_i2.p1 TRINITY_DN8617_c0_g1~~TRINITY_DN8617_c0_g1_i2.p1  ORF type:complete len:377 (-),score=116.77 TRINITY_DN8617_c0_g1_i2:36-1166(-)
MSSRMKKLKRASMRPVRRRKERSAKKKEIIDTETEPEEPKLSPPDNPVYMIEGVPCIVARCLIFLDKRGIKESGIFRISANANDMMSYQEKFNMGHDVDLLKEEIYDEHLVAGLLKQYFRSLPSPVFPEDMEKDFMSAAKLEDDQERIEKIKELLEEMNPRIVNIMKQVFNLLYKVSLHSETNMMTTRNIATCWTPTLFASPGGEAIYACIAMIDFCHEIYGEHIIEHTQEQEEEEEQPVEEEQVEAPVVTIEGPRKPTLELLVEKPVKSRRRRSAREPRKRKKSRSPRERKRSGSSSREALSAHDRPKRRKKRKSSKRRRRVKVTSKEEATGGAKKDLTEEQDSSKETEEENGVDSEEKSTANEEDTPIQDEEEE